MLCSVFFEEIRSKSRLVGRQAFFEIFVLSEYFLKVEFNIFAVF